MGGIKLNLATISILVGLLTQGGGFIWYLSGLSSTVESNSANILELKETIKAQPYDALTANVSNINSRLEEMSMTDLLTLFQMSGTEMDSIGDRLSELEKLQALIELRLEMIMK
jgi:Tfp pilus assembly protein PilO